VYPLVGLVVVLYWLFLENKKMGRKLFKFCSVVIVLCVTSQCFGMVTIIDFEGMPDMVSVTNQYAPLGVNFQEGIILTAFSSLNEVDFPPHSGDQVLGDDMGPIVANFITPVSYSGAYFTYSKTLNLYAYDSSDNLITTASSLAYDNYGENEFISLSSVTPISRLVIAGNPLGGSFIMDDFEFEPTTVIPAPGALLLGMIGTSIVGFARRRKMI
jgi:hypothetical protein